MEEREQEQENEWNVSADFRGMARAGARLHYNNPPPPITVLVCYSPWPSGDMAFNKLPAVKQTTSINSSDWALAFLSLSHPWVCVSMWFKPSFAQSFCLPTGCISHIKVQIQCCLLQRDLLSFIISMVSISTDSAYSPSLCSLWNHLSTLYCSATWSISFTLHVDCNVCVCVCV